MRLPAYEQLSEEQDRAIHLDTTRSYLITGPPGSGKTVVALHRSSQFRESGRLIMYSKVLTGYTGAASAELDLDPKTNLTFHRYMYGYWSSRFGGQIPQIEQFKHDWDRILERVLTDREVAPETNHLVIDEGQDLPREFYLMLQRVATGGFTIFADENQQMHEDNSDLKTIRETCNLPENALITLRRNYRNTREIAMVAKAFYTGLPTGVPELPERRGELPTIRRDGNRDAVVKRIANHIRNHPDRTIGVLLPKKSQVVSMKNRLVASGVDPASIQYYSSSDKTPPPDIGAPGVKILAHASSKGLEFDSVFLPWIDEWGAYREPTPAAKTRMYVLTSRAREYLEMTHKSGDEPELLSVISEEVVDRRGD